MNKKRIRVVWFILGLLVGVAFTHISHRMISNLSVDAAIVQKVDTYSEPAAPLNASTPEEVASLISTPEPEWPRELEVTVKKGDTLAGILTEEGISSRAAYNIMGAMLKTFNPRKLREGHRLTLVVDKDKTRQENIDAAKLIRLSITLTKLNSIEVTPKASNPNDFNVKKITKKLKSVMARAKGTITRGKTLSGIANAQGTPSSIVAKLMKAYSYDVDFQRDIHAGDAFDILYEKLVTEEGHTVKGGDIHYAELTVGKKKRPIYYYEDKYTRGQFYNAKGESIVKKLLRTPVDGARISSGFGMRRHPILGYSKMHKGMDFAAPRGTKIYAAGDGVITYSGRKGGYGNYIRIKHNNTYSTAYAHCHKFAPGMRKGKKVRQGQVIAYVGSTGRSTGPHLHYEILKRGQHVNPKKVKFTGGDKLTGSRLKKFRTIKANVSTKLNSIKVASSE